MRIHLGHAHRCLRGMVLILLWSAITPPAGAAHSLAGPWDRYLWESDRTTGISPSASNLVTELRAEIQKVLDAGPLAPIRTVYADLEQDPYFLYWQGGRIITTLGRAWPQLTQRQQAAVGNYVAAGLDDERRAPWSTREFISPDEGARRELHDFHEARGWDRYWNMWGRRKPTMGGFYGLWLYADRSGDWDLLKRHYGQITELYLRKARQCDLYGTMGAHLAMARIARHFHDNENMELARGHAITAFHAGTNFARVEAEAQKYWKERYDPRQRGQVYEGWMFLDLCPEVGRYLADYVRPAVLQRNAEGLRRFPLFWLREAPYATRWTGDEGIGIPTELMAMIVPVQRWVAGIPAATLESYTRSAPICVGDCYWLEMLVDAIEATGRTDWVEVKL